MSETIIEGAVATIDVDGTPTPLKKLPLGHFKQLEKSYGSVEDALSTMKGIGEAIYLCAKRAGYKGTLEAIEGSVDVDVIQDIVVKISGQDHFVVRHDVAQIISGFIAATDGVTEENAPAPLAEFLEEHGEVLQALKAQCDALRAPNQGE